MYAYTHKEVYTTVLLGKWTKTTDPGGGGGHTCLRTNYTLWNHLVLFLQQKATVLDDNVNMDMPLCQFT